MPEETKVGKAVAATKLSVWKYFGAAFMETKNGQQAVSLTRTLALICFGMLMWKWGGLSGQIDPAVAAALTVAELDVPMALKAAGGIPDTLLYTFWGLLGGKTAESMMAVLKGKKAA